MSGSMVSTTPQPSGHLEVGALDLLPERKLMGDARARGGAKGPPCPDNPQFWDSTSQVGQSQGTPIQPGALGPTKTNSSLDDTGMKMVMPTWQPTPDQLAIPKDQPPAPAADRWNRAQRSTPCSSVLSAHMVSTGSVCHGRLSKPRQPAPPQSSLVPLACGVW